MKCPVSPSRYIAEPLFRNLAPPPPRAYNAVAAGDPESRGSRHRGIAAGAGATTRAAIKAAGIYLVCDLPDAGLASFIEALMRTPRFAPLR